MALQHQRKFRDRDRYIDRDRERQLDIKTHNVMIQIYTKKRYMAFKYYGLYNEIKEKDK